MRLFKRSKEVPHREPFAGDLVFEAIGYVMNDQPVPRPHGWEKVESEIQLLPAHETRAEGIEAYSHVIVVFYMDMAADAPEKPETMTLASGNTYGVFATRSQLRPNHLGVSAVQLLGREGARLRVRGLDAIDGTAVLDVKPYLPAYDAHPGAMIPMG